MPPKGSKTKMRTDYRALKKRYLKHEWQTIDEMCEKLKLSKNTIYKHTVGWPEEREEIEEAGEELAKEEIIETNAVILSRMLQRQIQIADALQIKAANRLLSKVQAKGRNGVLLFDKKGRPKMIERQFDDDTLAMMSLRFSGGVLGQLMRRNRGGDEGEGGSGAMEGVFDLNAPDITSAKGKEKIEQYSPDQLRLIIGEADARNARTKKGRG